MGGLYTTREEQNWIDLFCEECWDSDKEIGSFETAKELWALVKPSRLACIGCEKEPDCFEDCDRVDAAGADYDLLRCMELISEHAKKDEGKTVSLICRNVTNGCYFVNFKPKGYDFGEALALPSAYCLLPELEEKVALSLAPKWYEMVKRPERKDVSADGKTIFWYCEVLSDPEEDDEEDGAWYQVDGWYGWASDSDYVPPC